MDDVVMTIMQGDAGGVPFYFYLDGELITDDLLDDLEVTIGDTSWLLSEGDITYDSESGAFVVQFTQEYTLKLPTPYVLCQARLKFANSANDVVGEVSGLVRVTPSASKEEL